MGLLACSVPRLLSCFGFLLMATAVRVVVFSSFRSACTCPHLDHRGLTHTSVCRPHTDTQIILETMLLPSILLRTINVSYPQCPATSNSLPDRASCFCVTESKATNVGLSQRVYIIDETCLNSFNRAQVGACQCEPALTNVEPHSRIWITPTRFDSPGVTIERACPIRSRNTARTPYSGRLEYATGPLIGWAPNDFIAIRV